MEIALFSNQLKDSEIGGNCSECGLFVLVDAARDKVVSQAIRPLMKQPVESPVSESDDHFQVDMPQNEVLQSLVSRMNVGKMYNPAARYVRNRKVIVDWMCSEAENLGHSGDAVHHSVAIFDAYYSIPNIE